MTESGVFQAFNAAAQSIRSEMQSGFTSIHERIDRILDAKLEDAEWCGGTENALKSAHRRIDELRVDTQDGLAKVEEKSAGPGKGGWAGIVMSFIAAAAATAVAWIKGEHGK